MQTATDKKGNLPDRLEEISELAGKAAEAMKTGCLEQDGEKDFMRMLAENGYGNETLVTDIRGLSRITTDRRMEILEELAEGETESVKQLAEKLDRDQGNLSRDLDILFQEDMIEYDTSGRQKKPRLKHTRILAKPIQLDD